MIQWNIHLCAPVSRDACTDGRVGRKEHRRARPGGRQRDTPSGDGLAHCWEILSPQFASHCSWLLAASDDTGELTQRVCLRAACRVRPQHETLAGRWLISPTPRPRDGLFPL